LRGLNEYRLATGAIRQPSFHSGFDIVTLVTGGSLRRLGTYAPRQLLTAGSVELVSAGRGVNLGIEAVGNEAAGYVEIWIRTGPGLREPRREWLGSAPVGLDRPFASGVPFRAGSLKLRAGGSIARSTLAGREKLRLRFDEAECAYLVVRSGAVAGNAVPAGAGDALAITGPGPLSLEAGPTSEVLLIRMPGGG
jgi:redox-sensitive bicupin YhaK (pirin superfamily)